MNTEQMSATELLKLMNRAAVQLDFGHIGSMNLAIEVREAMGAVSAMAEREAALVKDIEVYRRALELVESTFQPTSGPLGAGRYSFPGNGATADAVKDALANTSIPRAGSDALVKEVEALRADAEDFRFIAEHVAAWHHTESSLPRILVDPKFLDANGNVCGLAVTGRDGVGSVSLRTMVRIIKDSIAARAEARDA